MKRFLFVVISLFCVSAFADSVRFGSKVLTDGDSIGHVREIAGEPSRIVKLKNDYGVQVGERWEYDMNGKSIHVTISGGKVESIQELR